MKNANSNVSETFRSTFNKVRRQLATASGFGLAFSMSAKEIKNAFRNAMIEAEVPSTPARIQLVNNWICRASKLGCV